MIDHRTILDRLEKAEAALLTWGFVDGGFLREEVVEHAREACGLSEEEAADALDEMLDAALVFQTRIGRRVIYRTRSAEAIRLLARLRQLFPRHMAGDGWRHAPTLVSDFRYSLRPRTYPERTIAWQDLAVQFDPGVNPDTVAGVEQLLSSRSQPFPIARFQSDSTLRILDDLKGSSSRGTIIGAGTGSGKTLAFYLPALAHVGSQIDGTRWTKALAIYPRNELLKDQFSDTFTEARRLDTLLVGRNGRKMTIGAFFGPTPFDAKSVAQKKEWDQTAGGFVCPYLRCPVCSGDMIWSDADVQTGTERLTCRTSGCAGKVEADEVVLTRSRMQREPPDLLFTTTETLNRQLSDASNRHIFGVGPKASRKPEIVLLDEVHTYEGTSGAQAAFVVRRWRHAVGRNVQFVGLSATLRDAQTFFANLVGLPDHAVTSIAPSLQDLTSEGAEYLLALRGDPVSGTSLLSTTIQASMLLRRALEPTQTQNPTYGSRLFVFTDDLDVTNRLYFDLLDAEGRDSWGRPTQQAAGPLANLRSSVRPDHAERLALGQAWDLCEAIGHHLDDPTGLHIGRTSSQDPGVAAISDVIVATASLDVGFNDPTVGAVLQHKAPRGAAQFLQRKGRAGRTRGMRPWTIVVLSDYGRDRLAYQGYDLMFDPALEARSLPIQNTYVLRMQAAFSFMDWLAKKMPSGMRGSIWMDLAGPPEVHQPRSRQAADRQRLELDLVERVLTDESTREEMLDHVRRALRLQPDQLDVVAWEAPRSLMMHVLPTLRRRLASGWASGGEAGADYQVKWQPLPEFVPANLFSDLNLPETTIRFPAAQRNSDSTETQSPVLQALRTFAPGRISRRYGIEHRYVRHWVPVDFDGPPSPIEIDQFFEGTDMGEFSFEAKNGEVESYRCIRPHAVQTELPPRQLLDSTNAQLEWRSQFDRIDSGDAVDVPSPSPWSTVISEVRFYSHARRSGIDLSRLAVRSSVNLAFEGGAQREFVTSFVKDGKPAALGFALDVDAMEILAIVPDAFAHDSRYAGDASSVRSFRSAYFAHLVESDEQLLAHANGFQLGWLSQLYLTVVVERALENNVDLKAAHQSLNGRDLDTELKRVLDVIFQALPSDASDDQAGAAAQPAHQRLHEILTDLVAEPVTAARLDDLAKVLWENPNDGWRERAMERFATTLGAALLDGADRLCRDVGAQNLILDFELDPSAGTCRIWLSEPTIGGGGIIEELSRRYVDDPRRFFRLVEAALGPGDFETVDSELSRTLELAVNDGAIASALMKVRSATGQVATTASVRGLIAELTERGVATSHPVIAALHARVLRPGSSAQSDAFLRDLIARWKDEERRLGIEIDARVFAFVASASTEVDQLISPPAGSILNARRWRFATIYGLMWPRGSLVRSSALQVYNPYHPQPPTDRVLVLSALDASESEVPLSDPGWRDRISNALINEGSALLRAAPGETKALRQAVIELQGVPVDAGYLMLYPRVIGFDRRDGDHVVRLELREAFQ